MKIRRLILGVVFGVLGVGGAAGQGLVRVAEDVANAHVVKRVEAVYPPIAKAANVEGVVRLEVVVDGAGNVTRVRKLDGSSLLVQASVDAVRQWKFSPVEEARGGAWVTEVSLGFGVLTPAELTAAQLDDSVNREYDGLDDACRANLRASEPTSVEICRKEVAVAVRFPDQKQRHLEVLDAHENLGRALLAAGDADGAKAEFSEAIRIARESMKRSDAEYAYVFVWRASSEASLRDGGSALADYAEGEASLRLAIETLPDMKKQYSFSLERTLRQHIALLKRMGRDREAVALAAEADGLVGK
jgi:TonB family protein